MDKTALILIIAILLIITFKTAPPKERIIYRDLPGYSYLETVFTQENLAKGTYNAAFNKSTPWIGGFSFDNGKSIKAGNTIIPDSDEEIPECNDNEDDKSFVGALWWIMTKYLFSMIISTSLASTLVGITTFIISRKVI